MTKLPLPNGFVEIEGDGVNDGLVLLKREERGVICHVMVKGGGCGLLSSTADTWRFVG